MSQAATVSSDIVQWKRKEDGQQKSQQVEHKNSGDSWFKLLGVQDTAGHERKPALFQQGRGEELYYYTAGVHRGKCRRWQYLEAEGNVHKLNKGDGGQLYTV